MIYYQQDNSRGNHNYNAYVYENLSFAFHFHKNMELLYVLEGEVELLLDSRQETVKAGEYALIFPNQIHSYQPVKPSKSWVCVFSGDYVAEFERQTEGCTGVCSRFRCPAPLQRYLEEAILYPSVQAGNAASIYRRKACLYALCGQYLTCNPELVPVESGSSLSHRIIQLLSEQYGSDITLKGLSEQLGYDYHYLSRYFHRMFRTNFRTFLNQYRVDHAAYLLSHTEESITAIAFECGFQSIRSFNRAFRELAAVSPSKYSRKGLAFGEKSGNNAGK